MLKVLHTKAAAETILLVTTCHNMNLLAIVTRSMVIVYRSTTLTVVTTLPLALKENETSVSACWSPSGRLLAVGLQTGEVYLLDVESGDLVRRFVPRTDIALSIKAACRKKQSGTFEAPTDSDNNNNINNNNEDEDNNIDDGSEKDPLCQPPVLPISVDGAIVACTWTSVVASTPVMRSQNELCLPLRSTVSSPIFEELEREDDILVMLLLDQRGVLSFLPGGMQEVCVVLVNLPLSLDPHRVRVEEFFVVLTSSSSTSTCARKKSVRGNVSSNVSANCSGNTGSNSLYLVLQYISKRQSSCVSSSSSSVVVHIDLSDTIVRVANRETVAICSIAEYCRMGKLSYQFVRKRWESLLLAVRKDLLLPQSAFLIRDALLEDIAQPSPAELTSYFKALNLDALLKDAEELSRQFAHLLLQVSNVSYRCYDLALHLSQVHSGDRQRQCLLMDVIGGLRQRCSSFLRQMRLEVEREKDLVQWVVQRAVVLGGDMFGHYPPLRAVRQPSLLRTLHRISRGESTAIPLVDENTHRCEEEKEEELAYIVKGCLLGSREAVARIIRLPDDEVDVVGAESTLWRQCELIIADMTDTKREAAAGGEGGECVQMHTVTVARSRPYQPFMSMYTCEPRGSAEFLLLPQRENVPVEIEPLHFTEEEGGTAAFLWSGVVDGGRCVFLWENTTAAATATPNGADNTSLVVALVDENGGVEISADVDDNDEAEETKYAMLEIKGISTQHLRASVSRARGFGVFYAKERFVVVDFYGG